jgi:hypothetical protein
MYIHIKIHIYIYIYIIPSLYLLIFSEFLTHYLLIFFTHFRISYSLFTDFSEYTFGISKHRTFSHQNRFFLLFFYSGKIKTFQNVPLASVSTAHLVNNIEPLPPPPPHTPPFPPPPGPLSRGVSRSISMRRMSSDISSCMRRSCVDASYYIKIHIHEYIYLLYITCIKYNIVYIILYIWISIYSINF